MTLKIISVVGARPNFIKIAPLFRAIEQHNRQQAQPEIEHILVHTGQHYDDNMSRRFFHELNIPEADINLGVGSGTHAEQVGQTMIGFEKVLREYKPDWVVVVGDVNATLACSVTAKKEWVKVCHVEAGLRSGDMKMPEEVNRIVTDRLSDLLLTPDVLSAQNLVAEGIPERKIAMVGNIMIDTLEANRSKAAGFDIKAIIEQNNIKNPNSAVSNPALDQYAVVTLHRPSNVDETETLKSILQFLVRVVSPKVSIVWPLHPRTHKKIRELEQNELLLNNPSIILLEPVGYHEMLRLNMNARMVITDSGGLQEECTILGTPCITLRENTERPVTLLKNGGTSVLVGTDMELAGMEFFKALTANRQAFRPPYWDGETAPRCLKALIHAHRN